MYYCTARHALLALPALCYAAVVAWCLHDGAGDLLCAWVLFVAVQSLFILGLSREIEPNVNSRAGPILSFWILLLLGGVLGIALTVELLFLVQGLMRNTRILDALPLLAIGGTCGMMALLAIPFFDRPGHAGGRGALRIVALTALAETAAGATRTLVGPAPTVPNDAPTLGLILGLLVLSWCALPYGWFSIVASIEKTRGPRAAAVPPLRFRLGSLLAVLILLACTLVSLRGDHRAGGVAAASRSAFCGATAASYLAWRFVRWVIAWEQGAESLGDPASGR